MGRTSKSDDALITGAQCQFARNKSGLTQAQLAKAVGVSRSQIANFETKGERFTPSEEVRSKLRQFFEEQDPDIADDFAAMEGVSRDDREAPDSSVSSRTMAYVRRLADSGCFRMSAELAEAQRDRLLSEIDKVRDRLEEIASTTAKPGVFDEYDTTTDALIEEADGLVKAFGFLCIVAFGYGFVTLPTPALLERKQKPATIADALTLKYAAVFKRIGIKKNSVRSDKPAAQAEPDSDDGDSDADSDTPASPPPAKRARSQAAKMPWER